MFPYTTVVNTGAGYDAEELLHNQVATVAAYCTAMQRLQRLALARFVASTMRFDLLSKQQSCRTQSGSYS
jgi:hypothetical protein